MSIQPELSVVVETLNYERGNEEILTGVLTALRKQTLAAEQIEVIVVVDPDKNPQLAGVLAGQDHPPRLVEAPGLHYYAQKNLGATEARAPVVAFLDSDCRPVAGWAETMLRGLREGGDQVAAVQGTVTTGSGIQAQAFALASFAQVQARVPRESTMLTGNNCAFLREDFLAEPFDEAPWFHGPEVKKICALRQRGLSVVLDPGAEVEHAFYPGLVNFLVFSCYWGWCFLHLRRGSPVGVPWAALFDRLGWFAPFTLGGAKMIMDTFRTLQQRRNLGLGVRRALVCCLFLYTMAPAIVWGGLLERLGRKPPVPLY